MKKNNSYTIIISIIGVFQIIFTLFIPLLTKFLIERALNGYSELFGFDSLYVYIFLIIICLILMIIFKTSYNILFSKFSLNREEGLKNNLFENILKKEISILNNYHAGEIEQLFHSDINNVIKKELVTIPSIVIQLSRLFISILLMMYIDWRFLIFILTCGIFGFLFAKIYSKVIKPHHKKVLEADGKANSFLVESINQMKLIQAFDSNIYANDFYNKLNLESINEKRKRNNIMYGANSGIFAFSNIIYVVALCYGAVFISKDLLTYGSLIAIIQLLNNIQNPILSMSPLLNNLSLGKTSENRINDINNILNIKDVKSIDNFDNIIFDDVSFTYDNNKYIIKDFNLVINKNDVILLSGQSGIGKTTLFMLLLGFFKPTSGRIYLKKDNEEIEISSATRGLFSYVPQENIIFSGSIRDNLYILTGKKNDEIIEALKLANIYDEIIKMPNGLDTKLNERGSGLSIGQIQRILIAAAILKDNSILLLDEFSSALDSINEDLIINNIKKLNKTIIYITHRNKQIDGQRVIKLKEEND